MNDLLLPAVLGWVAIGLFFVSIFWPVLFPDKISRRLREHERFRDLTWNIKQRRSRVHAFVYSIFKVVGRSRWSSAETGAHLIAAGYRRPMALTVFLSTKLAAPLVIFSIALTYFYLTMGNVLNVPMMVLLAFFIGIAGFWAPDLLLRNLIQRRLNRIRRTWPEALDILHLCVSAGMNLEPALVKVAQEIRQFAPDIADELSATVWELTYLQDRRAALEHLAERINLPSVREAIAAIIQSERYGVALADTLKSLGEQSRESRLNLAEKRAASLPPKLTVPMIVFFLPALFVVILMPAIINVFALQ